MNNRWRQIAKYFDRDDRWEYEYENKRKPNKCPCCKSGLSSRSWSDERGCVETAEICRYCGYENNWSYGTTMLCVGKKWYEEYGHRASEETVARIQNEFTKQINLYRNRIKKLRRKMYV